MLNDEALDCGKQRQDLEISRLFRTVSKRRICKVRSGPEELSATHEFFLLPFNRELSYLEAIACDLIGRGWVRVTSPRGGDRA
jgi:hypothetical protein